MARPKQPIKPILKEHTSEEIGDKQIINDNGVTIKLTPLATKILSRLNPKILNNEK